MRALARTSALAAWLVCVASAQAEDTRHRALEDYRAGLALYERGEYERALDFFLRSRRLRPNAANVANAAHTLLRLRRYDEAHELFLEVVDQYPEQLDVARRASIDRAIAEVAVRIGRIAITSNVLGLVIVDGRAIGRLPLARPVAVMPGRRNVRVVADGHASFETEVTVRARQALAVDARLTPLAQAGELRVEDPGHTGSTVFVDRAPLGTSPWKGTLGPGEHVVWTGSDARGSAPLRVIVVQGQRVTATARSGPLGARLRINVEPATATVSLDGVPLGAGSWEGRLPLGSYAVVASEAGYHSEARTLRVGAGAAPVVLALALRVDLEHPRWPRPSAGRLWVAEFAGPAFGPGLRGGPEQNCSVCERAPLAWGALAGVRGGYELPGGLSLELSGGYLHLASRVARSLPSREPSVRYDLVDDVTVDGGFVAAGVSQQARWSALRVTGRLAVGGTLAGGRIVTEGMAVSSDGAVPMWLDRTGDTPFGPSLFVQPELAIGARLGAFELGGAVGLLAFVTTGPAEQGRTTTVTPECPKSDAGCVATDAAVPDDAVHGPALLAVPQIYLRYLP